MLLSLRISEWTLQKTRGLTLYYAAEERGDWLILILIKDLEVTLNQRFGGSEVRDHEK